MSSPTIERHCDPHTSNEAHCKIYLDLTSRRVTVHSSSTSINGTFYADSYLEIREICAESVEEAPKLIFFLISDCANDRCHPTSAAASMAYAKKGCAMRLAGW